MFCDRRWPGWMDCADVDREIVQLESTMVPHRSHQSILGQTINSQWLYKKVVWITYGFYCIHNTMPMPTSPRFLLLDKEISSKVQKLKRKFPVEIKYIFYARIYHPEIKYESVGCIKWQCGRQMYTTWAGVQPISTMWLCQTAWFKVIQTILRSLGSGSRHVWRMYEAILNMFALLCCFQRVTSASWRWQQVVQLLEDEIIFAIYFEILFGRFNSPQTYSNLSSSV